MYLRWLFYTVAILYVLGGLGEFLVPDTLMSASGLRPDPTAIVTARYLGAAWLTLGYVTWIAATTPGSRLKLHVTRAVAVNGIVGTIATLLSMSSGALTPANGVLNIVLDVVFYVAGFAYYGWAKTEAATT